MSPDFLTLSKKADLETELKNRKSVIRSEIAERVQAARALGDLSENAEYHSARDEQGKNETRIQQIEHILKNARVIERSGSDRVELGATVVVKKTETGDLPAGQVGEKKYMLVDNAEADIAQNKISLSSPMGEVMIGKQVGDVFVIATPRGDVSYEIVSIS